MIYVKFYGPFAAFMPETNAEGFWETESGGKSIAEVLSGFDFGNANYITLVNNVRENRDYILQPGDKLGVMPLLAGG